MELSNLASSKGQQAGYNKRHSAAAFLNPGSRLDKAHLLRTFILPMINLARSEGVFL
jgi:hypothetical protein